MREKYLIAIKNAMFWHFSSSEIKDTIEEIDTYFDSAINNGMTEAEIIEQYGKPDLIAKEMRNEQKLIEKNRKKSVIIKDISLAGCIILSLLVYNVFSLEIASSIFVILGSVFIWFLAGNDCLIEILTNTKEKKAIYLKWQFLILFFVFILQLSTLVFVPELIKTGKFYQIFGGNKINILIYSMVIFLLIMTVFFLLKMLQGNIYMFFILVQNICIISSLFLYNNFLKNLETLKYIEFIFTPYFICLPVLFLYSIFIYQKRRGKKIGCTN